MLERSSPEVFFSYSRMVNKRDSD